MNRGKQDASVQVDDIEIGVQGLGIVDSAVDMRSTLSSAPPRHGGMWAWPRNEGRIGSSGDSDKENRPISRSRYMKVVEGRDTQIGVAAAVP